MDNQIKIVLIGLGPIGSGIGRLIAQRADMEIVGAVDIDATKQKRDVGEVMGLKGPLGTPIFSGLAQALQGRSAQVACVATSSSLPQAFPEITSAVEAHLHVISTCEELSYPSLRHKDLAEQLDKLAKKYQVAVLGTGVNPGYVMDALPLMLTAPCAEVQRIEIIRIVDAGQRRFPLQKKVGAGLDPSEFAKKVKEGTVRHVGLLESLYMVAEGLGWKLEDVRETIEPVMAAEDVETDYLRVKAGQAAGVRQIGIGYRGGEEVITLRLEMYVGAKKPVDSVIIEGKPPVRMVIEGGLHGDIATAAVVVNCIPRLFEVKPGLLTMKELPLPHFGRG